jgi:uncharacterized phage-associated protein
LIYFAHGWNLALYGQPLSIERFEAWDYGPVVRRLWERLRRFGSKPVTEKVADFMIVDGKLKSVVTKIEDSQSGDESTDAAIGIVRTVWDKYGRFSAVQLSELTHVSDGPWSTARRQGFPFITDESIERYFKTLRKI